MARVLQGRGRRTKPEARPFGRHMPSTGRLVSGVSPPAAAFANDHLASGALLQARDDGVSVPGRLALLGFGDFPIGRQLQPALSTVRPPREEIGRAAARAVLAALVDRRAAESEALAWVLIGRQST